MSSRSALGYFLDIGFDAALIGEHPFDLGSHRGRRLFELAHPRKHFARVPGQLRQAGKVKAGGLLEVDRLLAAGDCQRFGKAMWHLVDSALVKDSIELS